MPYTLTITQHSTGGYPVKQVVSGITTKTEAFKYVAGQVIDFDNVTIDLITEKAAPKPKLVVDNVKPVKSKNTPPANE